MTPARRRTRAVARALAATTLGLAALTPVASAGPAHAHDPEQELAESRAATHTRALARNRARSVDEDATPLRVTLTSMAPASVPRKGMITLTGRVANRSEETWQAINVAPFVGQGPITSRDDLAEAVATTEEVAVGDRVIDPRYNAALGDLAPGASSAFRIRVPVTAFGATRTEGVHWFGVHALGTSSAGRDDVADGRVRTFIPYVDPARARRTTVPVAVVAQLRERVRRDPDGRLNGPARWTSLTAETGRLSRLTGFAASAGPNPLTWVIDPAVIDALADYAAGNPALSFGTAPDPTPSPSPSGSPSESPSGSGGDSASPSPSPSGSPDDEAPPAADREAARAVLDRFLDSARRSALLTTGYADPDVAALTRQRPSLLTRAATLAEARLAARELRATPAVVPPDGAFDPALLPQLAKDTVVLLTDQGQLDDPEVSRLETGQELLLSDARASAGGPQPTRATDPLALRQRVLSEAALEAIAPSREDDPRPVTVLIAERWNPGPDWVTADFFGALAQAAWVRLEPLARNATEAYDGRLPYSSAQREQEVPAANVEATRALVRTGLVLGDLLDTDNDVTDRLAGAGLAVSSYSARSAPLQAAEQGRALDTAVREQMRGVEVTGTDFVTLSGGSGFLTVTLVNRLRQPITVGLRADTSDADVRVQVPEPVRMQPGQRTSRRLEVSASGPGVHRVVVRPVTEEGQEVGSSFSFDLRTSQVGRLIWYIIGAGGVMLVLLIGRRIVLRIRNHRWREDPV